MGRSSAALSLELSFTSMGLSSMADGAPACFARGLSVPPCHIVALISGMCPPCGLRGFCEAPTDSIFVVFHCWARSPFRLLQLAAASPECMLRCVWRVVGDGSGTCPKILQNWLGSSPVGPNTLENHVMSSRLRTSRICQCLCRKIRTTFYSTTNNSKSHRSEDHRMKKAQISETWLCDLRFPGATVQANGQGAIEALERRFMVFLGRCVTMLPFAAQHCKGRIWWWSTT